MLDLSIQSKKSLILKKNLRQISIIILFLGLIIASHFLYRYYGFNYDYVNAFMQQHKILAPFLFTLMYAVCTVLLIPTLPFNLGAGVLFGTFLGGFITILSTIIGATLSFLISRSIFGDIILKYLDNRTISWLEEKVETRSWQVLAFVRLCAALPTGLFNYLFGLTKIKKRIYISGTFLFLLPPSFIICAIGSHVGASLMHPETHHYLHTLIIVLTALALVFLIIPALSKMLIKGKQ